MLDGTSAMRPRQSVLLLRAPGAGTDAAPAWPAALACRGIDLIDCATPHAVRAAQQGGARAGLFVAGPDPARLRACEPQLEAAGVAWIGLFGPDLIALAPVRQFIVEYLFNFLVAPAQPDLLAQAIRHAAGMARMRHAGAPAAADAALIGVSARMQQLAGQIRKIARTDAAVLIHGQSGTGKELVARAIHRQSRRRDAPFVAVNCGAISPQLLQSELFGHEKGAFTGAAQRKIGRIEAAHGGTLLLDEIGDMPPDMQVGLLRFLQEKTIERVGGSATLALDVRILAASHVDLAEAVRRGRFREDLYYRIDVVALALPTLAERGADIEVIARHYLARFAAEHNRSLRGFSRAALDAMAGHAWPGNVRELVNRVQRAAVMAEGRFVQPADLGFPPSPPAAPSLEQARDAAELAAVTRALAQGRNSVARAAALLGVSRVTLYRLIDKHRLRAAAADRADALRGPFPERRAGACA